MSNSTDLKHGINGLLLLVTVVDIGENPGRVQPIGIWFQMDPFVIPKVRHH